jgi:hypothetical protein
MPTFSQRFGFERPRDALQLNDMDQGLRVGLWNWMYVNFLEQVASEGDGWRYSEPYAAMIIWIWRRVLKFPVDALPDYGIAVVEQLRAAVETKDFHIVYGITEAFLDARFLTSEKARLRLVRSLNEELELEQSGYRYIVASLAPIISENEIYEVARASEQGGQFSAAAAHISRALALLSDRENPDYRNSIKEAISAVEATCRIIIGKPSATLSVALKELEGRGLQLHTALREGLAKLYAYTSDEKGIRHSLVDEDKLTSTEARFMLVTCSAFSNFLIDKSQRLAETPRNTSPPKGAP